jgi:hypothetical protein
LVENRENRVKIFEKLLVGSSMDNAENRATSDSNFEEYNIRVFRIATVCVLAVVAMYFLLVFCMLKGNRGQGENSLVGFRKTKNVQCQCRHTCRVNNSTYNAIFNDKSNRNRHEKNPKQRPNCQNSTCTTMRHHEQLEEAREQAEQLEQAGPPVARRLSSLASYASQATNDDDDEGGAREILSIPLNSTKRRRKNASEPKLSDPVIVMNNAIGLINELQQRSGARRPLIAALFSGVQQESAAAAIGCGLRTVQRAFAESRDGNTAISNLFLFNDYVRYHVRESC